MDSSMPLLSLWWTFSGWGFYGRTFCGTEVFNNLQNVCQTMWPQSLDTEMQDCWYQEAGGYSHGGDLLGLWNPLVSLLINVSVWVLTDSIKNNNNNRLGMVLIFSWISQVSENKLPAPRSHANIEPGMNWGHLCPEIVSFFYSYTLGSRDVVIRTLVWKFSFPLKRALRVLTHLWAILKDVLLEK